MKRLLTATIALTCSILLTACGGGASSSTPSPSATSSSPTVTETPAMPESQTPNETPTTPSAVPAKPWQVTDDTVQRVVNIGNINGVPIDPANVKEDLLTWCGVFKDAKASGDTPTVVDVKIERIIKDTPNFPPDRLKMLLQAETINAAGNVCPEYEAWYKSR